MMTCCICGRPIEFDQRLGRYLHRLPRPAGVPLGQVAEREWGTELGLFTLATATHSAEPGRTPGRTGHTHPSASRALHGISERLEHDHDDDALGHTHPSWGPRV